ncbi:YlxR family protein [Mycolicibacterium pyrenivorans]|uniref:YlxR family protein n=1 Tax=Mycolicibacterium pyrenivorans TaxID=187102 RepID=UPI0021F353EE|nr:YlxR family protein [Mycolicibacterium pyrenivorans]MCV7155327.1 YlxR family protein [Mycolicibacterium pyrenivorans]
MIQREASARTRKSTTAPSGGPVRTCIGCRKRELAVELLRVVAVDSASGTGNRSSVVIVDAARTLPGRGAWLHRDPECLQAAIRRRAFGRALRITGTPDTTAVEECFSTALDRPATGQVAKNMSTP